MNKIRHILWRIVAVAFIGFTSCNEGLVKYYEIDEIPTTTVEESVKIIDANFYFSLHVAIEDESGRDLVEYWKNLSQDKIYEGATDEHTNQSASGNNCRKFVVEKNLAMLHKDDFISETLKIFKNDRESVFFSGKCIDYDWIGTAAIIWKFKGTEIPILTREEEIFGKNCIVPYSEVVLVRHDDGTYTLK